MIKVENGMCEIKAVDGGSGYNDGSGMYYPKH